MRARRSLVLLVALPALLCAGCWEEEDELDEPIIFDEEIPPPPDPEWGTDSVASGAVQLDTTITLDTGGVWKIDEPIEYAIETEDVPEEGMTYEQWRHVSDDTVQLDRREFDQARLTEYLQDPDLDYDRVIHHDNLWWERFTRWIERILDKLFGTKGGQAVWDNIHWVILALAILFVAWFFRKSLFGGVFGVPAKKARTGQVTEIEENIEELDLGKMVRDAERARNWRLALRYQWLSVLRRLVDDGLIKWQPRFTDADYLAQLKDPALRADFSELSFLFKWVWYGDAPMDEARYQRMKPAFEARHARPRPIAPVNKPLPEAPVTSA